MPKILKKTTALARCPAATKTRPTPAKAAPEPRELIDAAAAYSGASRAENTKRAYTNDFLMFSTWCEPQGFATTPALPGTVALYLTALAISEQKLATIERALVAICQAHKLHGFPSPRRAPEVTEVLHGILPTRLTGQSVALIVKRTKRAPAAERADRDRARQQLPSPHLTSPHLPCCPGGRVTEALSKASCRR
jgi:hypothetical protein